MPYVYFLKSLKDFKGYIGSTVNIRKRINEHNTGRVLSTKHRRPLILMGYQYFTTIEEAAQLEKKYKRSHDFVKRQTKLGNIIMVKNGV